jgi:hypothetical protein
MQIPPFILLVLAILAIANPVAHSHHHYLRGDSATPAAQTPAHERRGIAPNDPLVLGFFSGNANVHATWKYNWDSVADITNVWFRFVPMLYSLLEDHTGPWKENVAHLADSNFKDHDKTQTWLMAFNEPDNCE